MSIVTRRPRARYGTDAFAAFACGADFTLGDGRALVWLSQLAYETEEPAKIADILASWGLGLAHDGVIVEDSTPFMPRASTRCILADSPQAMLVAFAGTDPLVLANWITNLNARRGPDGIARGFNAAAAAVWPRLRPILAGAAAQRRKIVLSGHSLGGVLAALIAFRMSEEGVAEAQAVYTFGMPRAGGRAFAETYNARLGARTFRLVHGEDIVPTLGPSGLGFRHIGRHLPCRRGGPFEATRLAADTACDDPQFVASAWRDFAGLWREPRARVSGGAARLWTAAALAAGRGLAGMRSDAIGIGHELLPARIRDHLPDSYVNAFARPLVGVPVSRSAVAD